MNSISRVLGYASENDLAAAVRHWAAALGDDSECERLQAAKFCHEPTPGHDGWDDPRPHECTLEAAHDEPHRFAYVDGATG